MLMLKALEVHQNITVNNDRTSIVPKFPGPVILIRETFTKTMTMLLL